MELLAKGAALVMVLLTAMLLLCFLRRRRNLTKELWVMSAGYGASDIWICGIYMDEFNK